MKIVSFEFGSNLNSRSLLFHDKDILDPQFLSSIFLLLFLLRNKYITYYFYTIPTQAMVYNCCIISFSIFQHDCKTVTELKMCFFALTTDNAAPNFDDLKRGGEKNLFALMKTKFNIAMLIAHIAHNTVDYTVSNIELLP